MLIDRTMAAMAHLWTVNRSSVNIVDVSTFQPQAVALVDHVLAGFPYIH